MIAFLRRAEWKYGMASEITIEKVFKTLDEWRHLPAYQLERRADIFFALFLPDVLGEQFGTPINQVLVPEFPVKIPDSNQSIKVDYLALEQPNDGKPLRGQRGFLVELKTDMASRRDEQDRMLRYAERRGVKKLILDILEICAVTAHKAKYLHLLKLLSKVHLIEYRKELWPVRQGYSALLDEMKKEVEKEKDWPSLQVVYVQPKMPKVIDFEQFASVVGKKGKVGSMFATHLRKWAECDAGSTEPHD